MSLAQTVRLLAGTRRVRARSPLSGAHLRLIVLVALAAVPSTAQRVSAQQFFTATLTGAQQVPPVVSAGTGTGTVLLNAAETQIIVNLNFSGLGTPAILGHIHGPADPTQNAGVLFDFAAFVPHATSGVIPAQTFAITPAQVAELKAGLYYFNVHSETFQGGEIRGQIVAGGQVFTTTLTGAQQVPQVISQGTGTGMVALNAAENQMFVNLTFSGLNTPAILAHIHGNGVAGVNANVLFDFNGPPNVPSAVAGTIPQLVFPVTPAQVADLRAGRYYFNVHSQTSPGGEIRGQLVQIVPTLALDRTALRFAATNSGAGFVQQTSNQTVRLLQSGTGPVSWTATPSAPWITVSPAAGNGSGVVTIGVKFSNTLPFAGTTPGSVNFALVGAGNYAGPINLAITTLLNGGSAAPAGLFETPANNANNISGSIAVTGWAIDDVEVRAVHIMRDPVAGEGPGLVFIGDAVLVEGARGDIATAFPNLPRNTRAGWGYLMLTNFLPNQGNGTYTIHAIAEDVDGHSIDLGTKKITLTNAMATRPFGAIDSPGQGEVVSGIVPNAGWVLSRTPNFADPPDGGTVTAFVDGLPIGAPSLWTSRSDLSALFPVGTYPGVASALGIIGFDSTMLANGVHDIFWIVAASNGEADGIGSRFFTVANGANLRAGSGTAPAAAPETGASSVTLDAPAMMPAIRAPGTVADLRPSSLAAEVNAAAADWRSIRGRRGFNMDASLHALEAAADGRPTLSGDELDRFELHLGDDASSARLRYTGYTRVGRDLRPLPIGSRLDQATGVFTWHAGPGFLRAYDLVFVRWADGRATARQEVRIVVNPRKVNRAGAQVTIDLPRANAVVSRTFVVAGWALDPDALSDTGVGALHVWAYPVSAPGNPIFLGVTAYGGRRPDVGAVFGSRFDGSGFGISVNSLPPGTYDLAVFPWSTLDSRFAPAKVVRVTVR